jgi:hypothetical protein
VQPTQYEGHCQNHRKRNEKCQQLKEAEDHAGHDEDGQVAWNQSACG